MKGGDKVVKRIRLFCRIVFRSWEEKGIIPEL
jgi:hypothetical protein